MSFVDHVRRNREKAGRNIAFGITVRTAVYDPAREKRESVNRKNAQSEKKRRIKLASQFKKGEQVETSKGIGVVDAVDVNGCVLVRIRKRVESFHPQHIMHT